MTAREKEHAGGGDPTALTPNRYAASQAEGLRVLLSIAVSRAEALLDEIAVRDGLALAVPVHPAPEPDVAAPSPTEPATGAQTRASGAQTSRSWRAGPKATSGRHAVASGHLQRRGSRFIVFSAIGGTVFLLGLGLQAGLTGRLHVLPVVSYLIQAVASVEASFLLNRWLTWRDRNTRFWPSFARFNAQKTVTIALNLALYAGLLRLGMNYLIANVVLTVVFTVVNYVAGDRLVFVPGRTRPAKPAAPPVPTPVRERSTPRVSVVIPCRNNERTIGAAVQSLLDQDFPGLGEIILIGSPGDHTWDGLAGLNDPRLAILEIETPPGLRDANFKRDAAIRKTSGDLIALVDSDIVLPRDWMSRAVAALDDSGSSCVTGGLRSVHDSFWGRYTDSTWIGAKTPRITQSYTVTSADFGVRGRKPPITANALFTRELYDHCPIDPSWSHGSYEDYEWFWRVTRAGYGIFVCRELFGWHHHRRGLRALTREYRRSSRGCAYFIRAHRDCPFAKRRLRQVVVLPLAAIIGVIAVAAAAAAGHSSAVAALVLGCAAVLAVHQVARSRSLESLAYPVAGLALGLVFTTGLAVNLIQSGSVAAAAPVIPSQTFESQLEAPRPRRGFLHPLLAICGVQAALSLTLVWSNTAFVDEADYLWIGRLEIAHWLHGTSWPYAYADQVLSGSPAIYPPLGALADSSGGLAGARILSLAFMLGATVLLYLTASRLLDRTGALFASALWVFTEPTIRLAFATFDPLSVLLTALSAWLIVQAGYRRRRGEFVAAAAAVLALANVTAYSGIVIDPIMVAFAFLAWLPRMGVRQASSCTAWLAGGLVVSFCMLMTVSRSWAGLMFTVLGRSVADQQSILLVLNEVWGYSGLIICLALVGVVTAVRVEGRQRAALLALLGCAAFIVPAAQLHDQTSFSLDKHLAYGIWFAAIAGGYACSKLIRWLPGASRQLAAVCCVVAVAYMAANSWESAWQRYQGWANAREFIAALTPIAAQSSGLIYASGQDHIAEYYTPQGNDWTRWNAALQLDPAPMPKSQWSSYYRQQLSGGKYGVIVLFYSTTFSSAKLQPNIPLPQNASTTYQQLLRQVGQNSGEPGLPALTQVLATDPLYQLAAQGPYNSAHDRGSYAIWQKKEQT